MKYLKFVLLLVLFSEACDGQTRIDNFIKKAKLYGLNPKTLAEIKTLPANQDSTHLFIWLFKGGCMPCRMSVKAIEDLRKEKGFKVTYLFRLTEDEVGSSTKEFFAKIGLPEQDLVTHFFGIEEEPEMEGKKVINYPAVFIYRKGMYQGNVEGYVSKENLLNSLKPYL